MHSPTSQCGRGSAECRDYAGARARVGVDIVDVREVELAIERHGTRYLRRVYRPAEVTACASPVQRVRARRLAARFAAKEAVFKVLQLDEWQPAWTDVEVCRGASGACTITLHGDAALRAEDCGISELALSMSHQGDMAVALVLTLSANATREALS